MSDVSQGPGWWQASDGKWYPPEQAPAAAAPTAPPTAPPAGYGPPAGPPAYGPPGSPPPYGPPGAPQGYGPPSYGAPGAFPGGNAVQEDLKGARIGARAIDIGVVLAIAIALGAVFGAAQFSTDDDISTGTVFLVGLLGNIIAIGYEVLLVSSSGATLGKKALGLKIVKQDGSDLDLADAVRRHSPTIAFRVLSIIPVIGLLGGLGVLAVLVINFVMVLSKGSSLYDQVGGTRVVRAR